MKQIVSFKKDISFSTKIGEITSISLEHNLKMIEEDHIAGEFIVSGDYKITDISINREPFSYNLPFDINLDAKYKADKAKIDIDDFYYEVTNDQILNVNIDVVIDGIEVLEEPIIEKESEEVKYNFTDEKEQSDIGVEADDREVIDLFKEIETPPIDIEIQNDTPSDEKIKSLFDSFDDKNETFTTYHVHIVRENDTIESIATKYKSTKEEIASYNKIDELRLGDKIVIPASSNE
ncbi:MAG: LysM peptidoglycan-binding domain-containing protein [Bacilli bacterium]|jgi:LysM repeat protein